MSESREHQELIINMFAYVNNKFPNYHITVDIQNYVGDDVPNLVNNHRPDLYATSVNKDHYIIGEAKTQFDLSSKHSEKQITAFLNYLKSKINADFILSVPYCSSDRAKVMLYFLSIQLQIKTTKILIFDECDCWQLKEGLWHLI